MTMPDKDEKEQKPITPEPIPIKRGITADPSAEETVQVTDQRGRPVYLARKKFKIPAWLVAAIVFSALMIVFFFVIPQLVDRVPDIEDDPKATDLLPPDWDSSDADENTAVVQVAYATLYAAPDKKSARISEALLNEAVTILDAKDRLYLYVLLKDGVKGYMLREHLAADTLSISADNKVAKVVVRVPQKRVMSHARLGSLLVEAPMGTVLFADYRNGDLLRVQLPGMRVGWINASGVALLPPNSPMVADEAPGPLFVANLMAFYNSPIVPGGITTRGISLEGAIHVSALLQGIELSRDRDALIRQGESVRASGFSSLLEGDVIFVHKSTDMSAIETIAVRVSDEQLLVGLPNRSTVQLIDIASPTAQELEARVMAVRRYILDPD